MLITKPINLNYMKILINFLKNVGLISLTIFIMMTVFFLAVSFVEWEWTTYPNPFTWNGAITRIIILVLVFVAFLHSFDTDNDPEDLGPL